MDNLEKAIRYIVEDESPDAHELRKTISGVCQLPCDVLFPEAEGKHEQNDAT